VLKDGFPTLCFGGARAAEPVSVDGERFSGNPVIEGRGFWGLQAKLLLPDVIFSTLGLVFEAADEGLGSPLEGVEGCCNFDGMNPGPMLCLIVLGGVPPVMVGPVLFLVGVEKPGPCSDILGPKERFLGAGGPKSGTGTFL
jgi:hypothetical protein